MTKNRYVIKGKKSRYITIKREKRGEKNLTKKQDMKLRQQILLLKP